MSRCLLKRDSRKKYRFYTGKGKKAVKCRPSAAAAKMHAKKFGRSGSKAHKMHAKMIHAQRSRRMLAIRERRGMNRMM